MDFIMRKDRKITLEFAVEVYALNHDTEFLNDSIDFALTLNVYLTN